MKNETKNNSARRQQAINDQPDDGKNLEPPLPPADERTLAVAERLFGLKWALRKEDPQQVHEEWEHAADWIREAHIRQAMLILETADKHAKRSRK